MKKILIRNTRKAKLIFICISYILFAVFFMLILSCINKKVENLEKEFNNQAEHLEVTTRKITGTIEQKISQEGNTEQVYFFIVNVDKSEVYTTLEEYKSLSVGDSITYYRSECKYPIIFDNNKIGSKVVINRNTDKNICEKNVEKNAKDLTKFPDKYKPYLCSNLVIIVFSLFFALFAIPISLLILRFFNSI